MKAIRDGIWALMLPFIILFGLRFGIFTPTEAAVVVVVYCLFVACVIYRELPVSRLYHVFAKAAQTTAVVMFLVAAALVSSWLITIAEIGDQVVAMVQPLKDYPLLLMLALQVLVVVIGTALDMTPTILLLTPLLMPILKDAGIDPVYFGVVFMMNNSIGLITPPVGTVLNVTCGVTGVKMDDIIKGVLPVHVRPARRPVRLHRLSPAGHRSGQLVLALRVGFGVGGHPCRRECSQQWRSRTMTLKLTRRTLIAGTAAGLAMPYVTRAQAQAKTLRFAYVNPPEHPGSIGAKKFCDLFGREDRRTATMCGSSRRASSAATSR